MLTLRGSARAREHRGRGYRAVLALRRLVVHIASMQCATYRVRALAVASAVLLGSFVSSASIAFAQDGEAAVPEHSLDGSGVSAAPNTVSAPQHKSDVAAAPNTASEPQAKSDVAAAPNTASDPQPKSDVAAAPNTASAPQPKAEVAAASEPVAAPRNELAGLPAIAGNNVFGLLFGVTGSFTRFVPGYTPFRFRAQLTAVASVLRTDSGVRSPLQNVDLRLDFPSLWGGKVRLFALLRYQRIENVGYWGIGNGAGNRIPEDYRGPRDRYFTWKKQMAQANMFARYALRRRVELLFGLGLRAIRPELWEDTKLMRDLAQPNGAEREVLYGTTRQLVGDALVGLLRDTRDHEFNPQRGGYHELSFRAGAGPTDEREIRYGSTYLHLRWFLPLIGERLVLALRGLADVGFGSMPLVELGTMGGFTTMAGPASIEANRALPYGRQLGQVKLFGTTELRSTFYHFSLRRHHFGLGAVTFIDASRVTARLGGPRSLEGGPIARVSLGGGLRLIWGSALVVRVDLGVAPRADLEGKTHFAASLALGHSF